MHQVIYVCIKKCECVSVIKVVSVKQCQYKTYKLYHDFIGNEHVAYKQLMYNSQLK